MILRFSSGSLTPASAARKRSAASTTLSRTPVDGDEVASRPARPRPCAAGRGRRTRRSAGRRSPAARARRRRPSRRRRTARRSRACRRPAPGSASTCSSTMLTIVQVGRQPATSYRKCSSTAWPCSVCRTSGWNCTPDSRRVGVLERRDRRAVGRRGDGEAGRRGEDRVAVRHPDLLRRRAARRAARRRRRRPTAWCAPNSASPVRRDLAAERQRHRLEAVADAEDRHAGARTAPASTCGAPSA